MLPIQRRVTSPCIAVAGRLLPDSLHHTTDPHRDIHQKPLCKRIWGPASCNLPDPALGPRVNLASPCCSGELQPPPSWLQPPSSGKGPFKTVPSPLETAAASPKPPSASARGGGLHPHPSEWLEDITSSTHAHPPCAQLLGGMASPWSCQCPAAGMGVPSCLRHWLMGHPHHPRCWWTSVPNVYQGMPNSQSF